MFCKYCGKESGDSEVCEECKIAHAEVNSNEVDNTATEANTQEAIEVDATRVETNTNTNTTSSSQKPKSKIAAGLLGIFLGSLGVHNFYLGFTSKAIAQLLLTLIGWIACGLGPIAAGIWGLVEGIMVLTGSIDRDADGNMLGD